MEKFLSTAEPWDVTEIFRSCPNGPRNSGDKRFTGGRFLIFQMAKTFQTLCFVSFRSVSFRFRLAALAGMAAVAAMAAVSGTMAAVATVSAMAAVAAVAAVVAVAALAENGRRAAIAHTAPAPDSAVRTSSCADTRLFQIS